ncbi:MAG: hypothetical protein HYY18_07475 [Planctomycetes bacterium]|nr:hypothetical protein [Planctomycetota bacterium]
MRVGHQILFLAQVADLRVRRQRLATVPGVAGSDWVRFNEGLRGSNPDGTRWIFGYRTGWLLWKADLTVVLMDDDLEIRLESRQPLVPYDWQQVRKSYPDDCEPGEVEVLDYSKKCLEVVGTRPWEGISERGRFEHAMIPALHAFWASDRGLNRLSVALWGLAERTVQELSVTGDPRTAEERVFTGFAGFWRSQAIYDAFLGKSIVHLRKLWQTIASLETEEFSAEAAEIVAAYECRLLPNPGARSLRPSAIRKLPRVQQSAAWIARLADLRGWGAGWTCAPTAVEAGRFDWEPEGHPRRNAAQEVVSLGWDALPAVIQALDDPAPTRIMWRNSQSGSKLQLLRIGDVCFEIFSKIAGWDPRTRPSTANYPHALGDLADMKRKAMEWWKSARLRPPEEHWIMLLARNPVFAAERLFAIDRERFVPEMLRAVEAGGPGAFALLEAVAPAVTAEHGGILQRLIGKEDPCLVVVSARLLWERSADDSGAREVARRLATAGWTGKGSEMPLLPNSFPNPLCRAPWEKCAIWLLAEIPRGFALNALFPLLDGGSEVVAACVILSARQTPCRALAERVVGFLDDTVSTRRRDAAAESLSRLLGFPRSFDARDTESEKDEFIRELKDWWDRTKDSHAWADVVPEPE